MIKLARILTPIDFSDDSRHALAYALALARWYDARVTALHVFVNRPNVNVIPSVYTAAAGMLPFESVRADLVAHAQQFVAASGPGERPVDVAVVEAPDVYREIRAQAEVIRADLVVMGTHGRGGLDRLLLGSTTEKVLRTLSSCPVMTVPPRAPGATASDTVQFRQILCPVDFSDASLHALAYAMSLAEESDARLTLLHAVEVPPELYEIPLTPTFNTETIRHATEAERLRRLNALVPDAVRQFCSVDTTVIEGRASRAILRAATERHADLIVMGVQGRGAIDLMVFGSNTQYVIRGAECPVLTVRARGA
jgi:nucleotide-binding universal stress UspA family protein